MAGPEQRWKRDIIVAAVAAVIALGGAWLLFGGDDDEPDSVEANQPTTTSDNDGGGSGETDSSTTSTTAEPEPGTIVPGTHTVGRDIEPGRYIAAGFSGNCKWERLSDAAGNQVIASDEQVENQAIIDILETDTAFFSEGCSNWTLYEKPTSEPATSFNDGDWVVGEHIAPGTYHAEATVAFCMWTRANGFEHTVQEIVEEPAAGHVPRTLTIAEGERLSSRSCGRWVRVG